MQLRRSDEFNLHHSHQIYLLYFIEITISRETRKLVINTVVNRTQLPTNLNVVAINLFVLSQFILNISQVLVLQELKRITSATESTVSPPIALLHPSFVLRKIRDFINREFI